MNQPNSFTATEFKAKCLDIFDQLAARKLTRVTVTKRGKVVAVLTPPEEPGETAWRLYGCMKGTVVAPPGFDLTAPILDELFLADDGEVHG